MVLCLLGTPNPLQKAIFVANHHSDLNFHLAIVLIEAAGKKKSAEINTTIKYCQFSAPGAAGSNADASNPRNLFNVKWYIWGQERNTFYLVCLDSRIDLWVSGHNDCLGKSNTVYHLLSIWFIDWVDWSQFNQLESVILTSTVWYWSIAPRGFGPETKGGSVSFGWHLCCRLRWTVAVLRTLLAREAVCRARAAPVGFVMLPVDALVFFWEREGRRLDPAFPSAEEEAEHARCLPRSSEPQLRLSPRVLWQSWCLALPASELWHYRAAAHHYFLAKWLNLLNLYSFPYLHIQKKKKKTPPRGQKAKQNLLLLFIIIKSFASFLRFMNLYLINSSGNRKS